jgi:hypothetical protein
MLWIDPFEFIPPRHNCIIRYMTTFLDSDGKLVNWPNVSIRVRDFGGDSPTRYAVRVKPFNIPFVPVFAPLVDLLKSRGYKVKRDLFIASYDWRIAPIFSQTLFAKLKSLIESTYERARERVVLFGFSLGGFTLQHFLTHYVDDDWKHKYVEHIVLLAPSHAGTVSNFYNFWTQTTPIIPWATGEALSLLYESWPVGHDHMPNHVVYKDSEFIIGPNLETYKPKDVLALAKKHGRIGKRFVPIYAQSEAVISKAPKEPGVKTWLLYNSGRRTVVRLNFTRGWDNKPRSIHGAGDGNVPSEGIEWTCMNWGNTTCFDFKNDGRKYAHQPLITNSYVIEMVANLSMGIETPLVREDDRWGRRKEL